MTHLVAVTAQQKLIQEILFVQLDSEILKVQQKQLEKTMYWEEVVV